MRNFLAMQGHQIQKIMAGDRFGQCRITGTYTFLLFWHGLIWLGPLIVSVMSQVCGSCRATPVLMSCPSL